MFIIILEDNTIYKTDTITDANYKEWDEGLLDIVDIKDPNNPKIFNGKDWEEIDTWDHIKDLKE